MAARSHSDEREWMGITEAGRYANIDPIVLRGAIEAGELDAYEKPVTRGRKQGACRRNVLLRISKSDIDRYIRTHWRKADASTFVRDAAAQV